MSKPGNKTVTMDDDDVRREAGDGPEPQTNLQRLLAHAEADSLAAKLITARGVDDGTGTSLRAVLDERVKELREAHGASPDQKD